MADLREDALLALVARIKDAKDNGDLIIATFRRSPTKPIDANNLPAVFLIEGTDRVKDHSSRSEYGYPAKRELEVIFEFVVSTDPAVVTPSIREMFQALRKSVFKGGVNLSGAVIREIRTEGPTGYGLPDVLGMRLVLGMSYTDSGNL